MGKARFSIRGLRDFVVEGKKHGYASGKEASSRADMPGFKRFEFRRGIWKYVDEYTGMYAFFGTETVSFNEVPVWGMSYGGGVSQELLGNEEFSEEIYLFLLENLAEVSRECPFRGPGLFRNQDFIYHNVTQGDIVRFKGQERIISRRHFKLHEEVHQVQYQGGLIVPRDYGLIHPTS
jgi:hypothetical protein